MNLDSIQTPADLVNQNKEQTPFEQAITALTECNYADTRLATLWLVTNMLDFHKERAAASLKQEEEGNPLAWSHDAGKLEMILDALKEID